MHNNIVLKRDAESVTIRLLYLGEKFGNQDAMLEIPSDFIMFASRHRWFNYYGTAVTPDISKLNLFKISMHVNPIYVSFNELLVWYEKLDESRQHYTDLVAQNQENLFIDSELSSNDVIQN